MTGRDGRVEPVDILLVEPNPGDARLFAESFDDAQLQNAIHVVTSGDDAIDFIHRRGEFEDAPGADIVLLDLELPGTSGHDVLAELKGSPELRHVPVIVLTSSDAEEDIARSYDLHANAYVQKPVDADEFADLARSFEGFWLSVVKLPSPAT